MRYDDARRLPVAESMPSWCYMVLGECPEVDGLDARPGERKASRRRLGGKELE